ncbi:HepT-like ribonuclease domain-containing protein [Methanoculleus nereidis]|uniref:HepT-like ribonuclease domain-containing protein n=1 Tax=Methanoculleus nereidis TaxID=2735141 RepID=UPI002942A086|nr:HepT-like ribonuclease domain-containing protein [Methanoculleus sp. YWC-01]
MIGEATKCIPRRARESCPSLPWSEMAGMRDKLIHAYFGINRAIIWRTIRDDIPSLRSAMQALRDDLAADGSTSGEHR